MKHYSTRWAIGLLLISLAGFTSIAAEEPLRTFVDEAPFISEDPDQVIELAIALDTSDSMKSLIDAARLTLWDVVNELALLDPPPQLRVALLTYGNSANDRGNGFVRVEVPLTTDLDAVSERLFALKTAGGQEFVGRALHVASEQLAWSESSETAKLVFIAGNESAAQDPPVELQTVAMLTRDKELEIHTIYCGRSQEENAESWRALAQVTDGQFAAIDYRTAALLAETPYDREMAELGAELNSTYLPIGKSGTGRLEVQAQQDRNAKSLSLASAATRAQTKAGPLYSKEWDLVDRLAADMDKLYDIDEEDLPQVMFDMTNDEREIYIDELARQRQEIREKILQLSAQRREHVAEKAAKKKGGADSQTFDDVVRGAIRGQVEARGFSSREPESE